MVNLGEHFASDDGSRHSEWLRQQRWFIKARQDTQRRDDIVERKEDNFAALASEVVMATQMQIREFEIKLDSYDQAIVTALMENEERLEAIDLQLIDVRADLQNLLSQAHVMDDGRRVFKSEDGSFVIDEHGEDVTQDEIDFEMISGPTAEAYLTKLTEEQTLTEQRADVVAEKAEIIEFQERNDAAREQIEDGSAPADVLADLDADLLEFMPEAVRAHVDGMEPVALVQDLTADGTAPTAMSQIQNAVVSAVVPTPNL